MAEVTIRLIPDPETGKKNIIISMRSDEDALPHEHENMHRILADKIVQGGLAKASQREKAYCGNQSPVDACGHGSLPGWKSLRTRLPLRGHRSKKMPDC